MTQSLFVYGPLQFTEVLNGLQIKYSKLTPATIQGYAPRTIRGAKNNHCPASVEQENSTLNGILIEGINDSQLDFLDFFEESNSKRQFVDVHTQNAVRRAQMYVWFGPKEYLGKKWDKEQFEEEHLLEFCKTLHIHIAQYVFEENENYKEYSLLEKPRQY